ncbi:MAG: GNAT family N-acetyltransferase [Thermoleophilia bacterium]
MNIERLDVRDGARLRSIRLRALRDAPDAFGTTWEEAAALHQEDYDRQLDLLATFVATVDGRDKGLVRGAPDDDLEGSGYLISLWVAPEARGQGVGSALVDAVTRWAEACGLRRLLLDVGEANVAAISLYTSKGFVLTGEYGALPPPREHIREIQLVRTL